MNDEIIKLLKEIINKLDDISSSSGTIEALLQEILDKIEKQ